jgi:hypothetical protein
LTRGLRSPYPLVAVHGVCVCVGAWHVIHGAPWSLALDGLDPGTCSVDGCVCVGAWHVIHGAPWSLDGLDPGTCSVDGCVCGCVARHPRGSLVTGIGWLGPGHLFSGWLELRACTRCSIHPTCPHTMECCRYSCVQELIPVPGVAAAFVAGCKIAQGIVAKVAPSLGDASPIISCGGPVKRWVGPGKWFDRVVWLAPHPPHCPDSHPSRAHPDAHVSLRHESCIAGDLATRLRCGH